MLRGGVYTDMEGREKHYTVLSHPSSNNSFTSIRVSTSFLGTQTVMGNITHRLSQQFRSGTEKEETTLKDRATEIKAQSVTGSLCRSSVTLGSFSNTLSSLVVPDQSQTDTLDL